MTVVMKAIPRESAVDIIKETWLSVSPPTKEQDVLNKWHGIIYEGKKKLFLYIGTATQRFLEDENGPVLGLEVDCFKLPVGQENISESVPKHMPKVCDIFPIHNVISGPLAVEPLEGNRWRIPNYDAMKQVFYEATSINRVELAKQVLM